MQISEIHAKKTNITKNIAENVTKNTQTLKSKNFPKMRCLVVENKANHAHSFMGDKKQHALLLKMLAAINLDKDNTQCTSLEVAELTLMLERAEGEIETILLMADDMYIKGDKVFVCPHPADMIIDGALKRRAWEVLKRLKEYLAKNNLGKA